MGKFTINYGESMNLEDIVESTGKMAYISRECHLHESEEKDVRFFKEEKNMMNALIKDIVATYTIFGFVRTPLEDFAIMKDGFQFQNDDSATQSYIVYGVEDMETFLETVMSKVDTITKKLNHKKVKK